MAYGTGCVAALLRNGGAEAHRINPQNGEFPMLMASLNGHAECVKALLEGGADTRPIDPQLCELSLLVASLNGHSEYVEALLDGGADAGQINPQSGEFPLLMASLKSRSECVKALLERGEPIRAKSTHIMLNFHCWWRRTGAMRSVSKLGVGGRCEVKQPAYCFFFLLVAGRQGTPECVKTLLECRADLK